MYSTWLHSSLLIDFTNGCFFYKITELLEGYIWLVDDKFVTGEYTTTMSCSWPGQEMNRFLKAQSSNSVLSRQTVNKGYHLTRLVSITRLTVLSEKLTGPQCTEPVKSREPSAWFLWKNKDFLVTCEQQLGARSQWALPEHSLVFRPL